jgi:hypothetical protein
MASSARSLVAESLYLARQLRARPTWLAVGEDTRARREMIQSLFPRNQKLSDIELIIREGDPEQVIRQEADALDIDMVVVGPVHGRSGETALKERAVVRIARSLRCSLLLFPTCHPEGTRFRQVVCGIKYDSRSVEMLNFIRSIAHSCYTSRIHVVREYDLYGYRGSDRAATPATEREWRDTEKYLLQEFVQDLSDEIPTETAIVEGQYGSGVSSYTVKVKADLAAFPAPDERVSFWDHFFAHPLEKTLHDLDCCLLLYRDKTIQRRWENVIEADVG